MIIKDLCISLLLCIIRSHDLGNKEELQFIMVEGESVILNPLEK